MKREYKMKKVLILLAALFVALPGLTAQSYYHSSIAFEKGTDFSIGKGPVTLQVLSYLGWGVHLPTRLMYEEQKHVLNSEFFLNIAEVRASINHQGAIVLGVDWDRDCYRLDKKHQWQAADNGCAVWIIPQSKDRIIKSNLIVNTFSFPVSLEQRTGDCVLRLGAALDLNLDATTKLKTASLDGERIREVKKGISTQSLTYNVTASISCGGLGIYARYNPRAQFKELAGPMYQAITLGLVLGLGM